LSWIPYSLFCRIRDNDQNPISVDLSDYRIDKKFLLSLPSEDDGLSKQLRTFGFREPLNCECYVKFISRDDTLLDIGANIGFFTLLGNDARRIVCVEPLNNVIPLLQKNISQNNLSDKCEIVHAAVGPRGKLHLEISPHLNLSKIVSEKNDNTIEVDSIPLGDLVARYHTNVIRLDVEGFEHDILYGQIPNSVTKISMEFHTRLMGQEKSRRLLNYFRDEGFRLKYYVEDIPLRLYPFLRVLKSTRVSGFMSYIEQDLEIDDITERVFSGRGLKYLYLQRDANTTRG
jgi:FkbM family methyltransferase